MSFILHNIIIIVSVEFIRRSLSCANELFINDLRSYSDEIPSARDVVGSTV